MLKLSIIVPIYNVEPYLRKCVDSLLSQDLPQDEYEIILVDDGSPDACPAICDEYAVKSTGEKDGQWPWIHVIHRPNGGLSAARNSGLAVARGKYVQFVDSDDYLEPNVLGGLVAQMEREELDVLRFDFQNVRLIGGKEINETHDRYYHAPNTKVYEVFEPYKQHHFFDTRTDITDGITYLNERMGYQCYVTNYIIRREMLADIIFTEGILFEDTEWTPRMLLAAKRVNSTSKVIYNYLWRNGSITQTPTWQHAKKCIESLFVVNRTLKKMYNRDYQNDWLCGCISDNYYSILNNVIRYDYQHFCYWVQRLKQDEAFPFHSFRCNRNTKIKYFIINISPQLYAFTMYNFVYK